VIIGGGPAGNTAATYAARLGAQVTMIERDVIGGAAHLWDCIPSKTMIATGGAMSFSKRIHGMGLEQQEAEVDIPALTERIESIKDRPTTGHDAAAREPGCATAARHCATVERPRGRGRHGGRHTNALRRRGADRDRVASAHP